MYYKLNTSIIEFYNISPFSLEDKIRNLFGEVCFYNGNNEGGGMAEDKLISHSRAEKRERPHAFEDWLVGNCAKAVSHEEVRKMLNNKKAKIEKLVKK